MLLCSDDDIVSALAHAPNEGGRQSRGIHDDIVEVFRERLQPVEELLARKEAGVDR